MQKLAEICIERPVFATMLILALTLIGAFSYYKLGVDQFPKVDFPVVTVTTTLRGASPEEVETEITKKIEESVNTISGIDEMRSISADGISQVFITFVLERDITQAAQDVRDKVNIVLADLPRDIDPPIVERVDPDAQPIVSIVVSAKRTAREITEIADKKIKQQIESLSGVGQVRFIGERGRQIQIWLDAHKLAAYSLTVPQVEAAIATQNLELPGGRVDEGAREQVVRTLGRITNTEDFNKVILSTAGAGTVRISDVGYTEDGVEEPRSLARLDGNEAVVLEVRKQSGTNTVEVVNIVKERIKEIERLLPPDFKLEIVRDQSVFIENSFHAIKEHLILGGILAALVVLLFMRNLRSTLITAIAIPTSIISTYALLYYMGFTLNQMTMLALVLSVGIVIDDAIVVLENIYRFIEEKDMPPLQAAREATREIGLAVMATTLSLIIIFIPVAFMGGIVGRFMKSFGLTSAFAIGVSLFVSFTLTPMMCSRFLKKKAGGHDSGASKQATLYRIIERGYMWTLHLSMRHRIAVMVLSVIVIATTVPLFKKVGKDFIVQDDTSDFEINVRAPEGYSLSATSAALEKLEKDLKQLPGVVSLLTTIGATNQRTVNLGNIYVRLSDISQRNISQAEVMERARRLLERYKGELRISVGYLATIQGSGRANADVQYSLRGPDLARLTQYSGTIMDHLRTIRGVVDVDSSLITGKPELRLYIDRDRAADLGVRVSDIASAMRTLVGGNDRASSYREGDERYDVQVRAQLTDRNSAAALTQLTVPSSKLGSVRLDQVVRIDPGTGPAQIDRYNRQRQVTITANIERGQTLGPVLDKINAFVAGMKLSPEYQYGIQGRSREFGRAAANFAIAFVLSFIFMYMILAAQFESFIDPITILLSLPLSVPFALFSLIITQQSLNIYSALGVLMLFGIVKKNSILQIDHANELRRRGYQLREATIEASRDRLRPILMTTLALVAGMLPMAVGQGAGSGSRRSVAIVVIGGQSLCLLLTLLVTPVAYSLFEDLIHLPLWARLARVYSASTTKIATLVRLNRFFMLLIAAALALAPITIFAQQQQRDRRIGIDSSEAMNLTLADAIRMALENNRDIEIERINVQQSGSDLLSARGIFDPSISFSQFFNRQSSPITSALMGGGGQGAVTTKNISSEFLVRGLLNTGGSYEFSAGAGRFDTSNIFTTLNPQTSSALTFTFRQPLLRNRETDEGRRRILVAQKRLDISDSQFRQRVIEIITQVERAYWDLVFARENVGIATESVMLARTQLERSRRLVESGANAPVDLVQIEAQLQKRNEDVLVALEQVTRAENGLKLLVLPDRSAPQWHQAIAPVDKPQVQLLELSLEPLIMNALSNRPELKQLELQLELTGEDKRYFRNQTRPQFDFVATYQFSGLAGSRVNQINPFTASNNRLLARVNELSALLNLPTLPAPPANNVPDFLTGGIGQSLANLFQNRFNSFRAGIVLQLPLRNRTAEGQLQRAQLEERKAGAQRQRIEAAVEAEVRNALQSALTAQERIAATKAAMAAAEKQLESEQRRYEAGMSTNFLVLTRQQEFSEARGRGLRALTDYNKALAELQRATGSTLTRYNVEVR